MSVYTLTHRSSELAEPQKLLSHLIQPRIFILGSDIIAVYLQAAMKVFGTWTADLAGRWDDNDLPKVKNSVEMVLERTADLAAHADFEVQERVRRSLEKAKTQADWLYFIRPQMSINCSCLLMRTFIVTDQSRVAHSNMVILLRRDSNRPCPTNPTSPKVSS